MKLFNRKAKEKYVLLPKKVFRAIKEALDATCELKRKLNEYQETELSPDEIHMMSERLAEFELAGIEPSESKILAERNRAKPAEIVCGMAMCPVCGRVISAAESLKNYPICSRCGQRVAAGNAE